MRRENGFEWPEEDHGMRAVAFDTLPHLDKALSYVNDFSCCVQAGGNVGVWPKYLANKFSYVYTFEPCQDNFGYLCRNVSEKNVYKFPAAVGNGGNGFLVPNKLNVGAGKMAIGGTTPFLRIDDLCLESCGFIQLDVEGGELNALRGAAMTIRKYKPILMIEEKGIGESVLPILEKWGYKVMEIVGRDLICST